MPAVTIVLTQRERLSVTPETVRMLYERTKTPFELVFVDGGAPPSVQRELDELARQHGFRIIRTERYLNQNQARNLALATVTTPYVCFLDNDAEVFEGWLDHLLDCATSTGACAVGPLYGQHTRARGHEVHTGPSNFSVETNGGVATFRYRLEGEGNSLDAPGTPATRQQCEHLEYHCMMVATDVINDLGGLDEGLPSTFEHVDLCLSIAQAGGTLWFEPAAFVSYHEPPPIAARDLPYYWLHWSDAWNDASASRMAEKWGFHPEDHHRTWLHEHRSLWYHWLPVAVRRVAGRRVGTKVLTSIVFPVENLFNRAAVRVITARQQRLPAPATRVPVS